MASRKSRSEEEKLDPANLEKVIRLLEDEKPITKKLACEMLGIAYNTTRLGSLIEKHKEKKARDKQRREEKRGKPASPDEVKFIVESYLEGGNLDGISNTVHRSAAFVKAVLDQYNVPMRARAHDYFKPVLLPEGAVRTEFKVGETVYCARYDSIGIVESEVKHPSEKVYRLWLPSERWQQYCYQPASELASLEHLTELGIKL